MKFDEESCDKMKTYVWFYEWEEIPPSPVLWKT